MFYVPVMKSAISPKSLFFFFFFFVAFVWSVETKLCGSRCGCRYRRVIVFGLRQQTELGGVGEMRAHARAHVSVSLC